MTPGMDGNAMPKSSKPSPKRLSFTQSVPAVPNAFAPVAMAYTAHMMRMKSGRPRIRFVTTRSIFSEMLMRAAAFFTHSSMMCAITA